MGPAADSVGYTMAVCRGVRCLRVAPFGSGHRQRMKSWLLDSGVSFAYAYVYLIFASY